MQRSIVFNTQLNKYILSASRRSSTRSRRGRHRLLLLTSDDLIHWTDKQLMMEVETQQSHLCGDPDVRVYPSLIDHDSPSRNFETIDNTTYLYYTVWHYTPQCIAGNDRDMARIPIQFLAMKRAFLIAATLLGLFVWVAGPPGRTTAADDPQLGGHQRQRGRGGDPQRLLE